MRSLAATAGLAMVTVSTTLGAQVADRSPTRWDVTVGRGDEVTSLSIGALRTRDVLANRLRLGLGVRSTFVNGDQGLTPAGAKNVPAGVIDTLYVPTAALMLNVAGHLSVVLTSRFEAGLNIDLAGVGFGATRDARYRASQGAAVTTVEASPSSTNVFLYGSNDRGSLNSEFFAAWKVNDRYTLRGGLSHQLTEYRAERNLSSNTDRFRFYSNLLFIGARITR